MRSLFLLVIAIMLASCSPGSTSTTLGTHTKGNQNNQNQGNQNSGTNTQKPGLSQSPTAPYQRRFPFENNPAQNPAGPNCAAYDGNYEQCFNAWPSCRYIHCLGRCIGRNVSIENQTYIKTDTSGTINYAICTVSTLNSNAEVVKFGSQCLNPCTSTCVSQYCVKDATNDGSNTCNSSTYPSNDPNDACSSSVVQAAASTSTTTGTTPTGSSGTTTSCPATFPNDTSLCNINCAATCGQDPNNPGDMFDCMNYQTTTCNTNGFYCAPVTSIVSPAPSNYQGFDCTTNVPANLTTACQNYQNSPSCYSCDYNATDCNGDAGCIAFINSSSCQAVNNAGITCTSNCAGLFGQNSSSPNPANYDLCINYKLESTSSSAPSDWCTPEVGIPASTQ